MKFFFNNFELLFFEKTSKNEFELFNNELRILFEKTSKNEFEFNELKECEYELKEIFEF